MDLPPYSPDLAPSDFHLFLHLKKFLGSKRFDDDDDLKDAVQKWLTSQAAAFYEEGIQTLCPATISASIIVANIWKNSLKNVESDNDKILHKTLLDFFLQRNGTYFLNKPHNNVMSRCSEISEREEIHAFCCLVQACITWEHLSIVQKSFVNPTHKQKISP